MNKLKVSALSPFKYRQFTVIWVAALVSNIGHWMHSVGASWLMTDLSPSPLVISLVQTVATLPIFIFALPAGALADIFNRKHILLITNILMLLVAFGFTYLVWVGKVDANILLATTFLLGVGAAFMAPAWQAIVPEMVSQDELPQAVTLGGISVNISRAIGPALAGVLISIYGLTSPFLINAISFVVIILALLWWKHKPKAEHQIPHERVFSAMKVGVKFSLNSQPLRNTVFHVVGFMFFANSFWGLLPIISKETLNGDASYFGLLMSAIGIGAVFGAFILAKIKAILNANQIVAMGSFFTSIIIIFFAINQSQVFGVLTSFVFGISWIFVLASVNVAAQQALPEWVRARGLAVFMMAFFGSMSLGSVFWGWLAGYTSLQTSLIASGIGGVLSMFFSFQKVLQQGIKLDLTPSHHWPEPKVHDNVNYLDGPVIIQITYILDLSDVNQFLSKIQSLKQIRQRDGAFNWGVYQDTYSKEKFIEHFMEDNWVAHLRHHHRVTKSDQVYQDLINVFHQGTEPPLVKHYLAQYEKREKT